MMRPWYPILFFLFLLGAFNSFAQQQKEMEKAIKYADKKMGFVFLKSSNRYSNDFRAYYSDTPYSVGVRWMKVDSFFISKYEVSNADYDQFLEALSKNPELEKQFMPYDSAYPIDLNWEFVCLGEYNHSVLIKHYLEDNHIQKQTFRKEEKAYYDQLPQVNITYEQAVNFCKWKTMDYNTDPKRKFKKVRFRLPAKLEWEYAAQNGEGSVTSILYFNHKQGDVQWSSAPFDENGKLKCNFSYTAPGLIHMDTTWRIIDTVYKGKAIYDSVPEVRFTRYWNKWHVYGYCGLNLPTYLLGDDVKLNDFINTYFPILPVETFGPQRTGLYQMAGNVREMVQERGLTKGGSWRMPYAYNYIPYTYKAYQEDYAAVDLGFRLVMDIIEVR